MSFNHKAIPTSLRLSKHQSRQAVGTAMASEGRRSPSCSHGEVHRKAEAEVRIGENNPDRAGEVS